MIPQKPTPTVYEQSPGKGREVVVGRSLDGLISFPDDDGLRLAVWIERMLIAHCAGQQVDVVKLANQLRMGVKADDELDRKSTRLNSSHSQISYAVFCLKKK